MEIFCISPEKKRQLCVAAVVYASFSFCTIAVQVIFHLLSSYPAFVYSSCPAFSPLPPICAPPPVLLLLILFILLFLILHLPFVLLRLVPLVLLLSYWLF